MSGLGMRGKDVRVFCMIARKYNIYILVRQTNQASLNYVGKPGYYPKPAAIKAKTADIDPAPFSYTQHGQTRTAHHEVAGLVPHPGFQPAVYGGEKLAKAQHFWLETLNVALTPGSNIPATDLKSPSTWTYWGKEHTSAATGWRWKVDVDPSSQHFGCLQLARDAIGWSYIHGDYDLKDVITGTHHLDRAGAFEQVHDSRAADVHMGFVHLHRQADIAGRVLAGKGGARGAVALGQGRCCQAVAAPLGHQPDDLRAAVAAGVPEVAQQHAAFAFGAMGGSQSA